MFLIKSKFTQQLRRSNVESFVKLVLLNSIKILLNAIILFIYVIHQGLKILYHKDREKFAIITIKSHDFVECHFKV